MTMITRKDLPTIFAAWATALVLSVVAYRSGRMLTFDGYHYCEFAKKFTTEWPDRFGNHWPFGYPLLGGLLGRIGLPAYDALCVISVLSLGALIALAAKMIATHPDKQRWVLLALPCAPIVGVQLLGNLTELPFAALLLGLAFSFSRWPDRSAIWNSALLLVACFCIRYAGILGLGMMAGWMVLSWQRLHQSKAWGTALLASAAAGATIAFLLFLNIHKSGHASGAGRGESLGFLALPSQLSDIGWSAPSAFVAGGLRDRIGAETLTGHWLGGSFISALFALCLWSYVRPKSPYSQALAWVTLTYLLGMAALRCIGSFDSLYVARTFLPVLFSFCLLLAERARTRERMVVFGSGFLIIAGLVSAGRGVSREIAGDVRPAIGPLAAQLQPSDQIAINDHAFSLGAYFKQRTERAAPQGESFFPSARFLVVAGAPANRLGESAPVTEDWRKVATTLTKNGEYRALVDQPALLVLQRVEPAAP